MGAPWARIREQLAIRHGSGTDGTPSLTCTRDTDGHQAAPPGKSLTGLLIRGLWVRVPRGSRTSQVRALTSQSVRVVGTVYAWFSFAAWATWCIDSTMRRKVCEGSPGRRSPAVPGHSGRYVAMTALLTHEDPDVVVNDAKPGKRIPGWSTNSETFARRARSLALNLVSSA